MNKAITPERLRLLKEFCKKAGTDFQDIELLDHAFFHRSAYNEHKKEFGGVIYNNERLEFLGDSVLGMVTASWLFRELEDSKEGELAKIKSSVVSEKALAPMALKLGIDKLLVLGHGEEMTGGRNKPAILADCMEAVIGAYYLDKGYRKTEEYVLSFIVPEICKVLENGTKDFKTQLQEFSQKKFKITPEYELLGTSGPEHEKTFRILVHVKDKKFGPVSGSSKKEAEQKAAELALKSLIS